jgi:hypothetical protein
MATQNHSHVYAGGMHRNITFRIDEPVYQALSNASTVTGMSMNSLVNTALASYFVNSPPRALPKPIYRSNYEETIRKLAGQ